MRVTRLDTSPSCTFVTVNENTALIAQAIGQPIAGHASKSLGKDFHCDSGEEILPCMRHHSRTEALAMMREDPKARAERRQHDHELPSLIAVRGPEDKRLRDDPDDGATAEGAKLLLQVAPEDDLFAEAGSQR